MAWFGGKKKKELTERDIAHALMEVPHPESNRDVVAMGMVKNLSIKGDRIGFDLELPRPDAPYAEELRRRCQEAVVQAGAETVKVRLTSKPKTMPTGKRPIPNIGHILAVASGKGGVGKSTIAFNLARAMARQGKRVGLLDCDIYGPSLPSLSGIHDQPKIMPDQTIVPHEAYGLKLMSMGYLVAPDHAVAWRGPMTHKMMQQFFFQVQWGPLDVLVLDLPPGTGDVQLSMTQLTEVSAGLIVTTPQEVACMDARKGVKMFQSVGVPVLGFVENMSYYLCGKCEKRHEIFKRHEGGDLALEFEKEWFAQIPLTPNLTADSEGDAAKAWHKLFDELAQKVGAALDEIQRPVAKPEEWAKPSAGAFEV